MVDLGPAASLEVVGIQVKGGTAVGPQPGLLKRGECQEKEERVKERGKREISIDRKGGWAAT